MRLLGYFSNFILLACFVGMGLGLLRSKRRSLLPTTMPWLLFICLILSSLDLGIELTPARFEQSIYFGAEQVNQHTLAAPFWVVLAASFLCIAILFVGPGQAIGRLFEGLAPLEAYSWNIGGSLLGVAAFMGASALSLSPVWWFGITGCTVFWLLRRSRWQAALSLLCLILSLALIARLERGAIWSPYNRITLEEHSVQGHKTIGLFVNQIVHQGMAPLDDPGAAYYDFPYLLNRLGRGRSSPGRVLVIGAGTGNDVSHILAVGASAVDAVEIDPSIQAIGKAQHPAHPYADLRVSAYVDDGRAFLRHSEKQYDFIVYGVIDSLSLLSQFGSMRLENYLFTQDAFRDVKSHLAPNGIFAMYNFFRQGWLAMRMHRMLESVFGPDHVVMMMFPPREVLDQEFMTVSLVMFLAGDVATIRRLLDRGQLTLKIAPWQGGNFHGTVPLRAVQRVQGGPLAVPTDDWPFLYLHDAAIPVHIVQGMATIMVVSLLLVFGFGGVRPHRIRGHFFFLGAAFMLVETDGIARLALLFGSTWINNSLTFAGILALALLANCIAASLPKLSARQVYIALFAALLFEYLMPLGQLLQLPSAERAACGLLVLFLPVFFSGLVFARSFRGSANPEQDLGANLLGAVAGGLLENLSVVVGYHGLLLIVALTYAVSLIGLEPSTE